jgi:hypothetical protein
MIPIGWYYVDLMTPKARESFRWWVRSFPGFVKERKRTGDTWVLFRVVEPVPRWDAASGIGAPTRAPNGHMTSKEDTIQRPEPTKGALDTFEDAASGAFNFSGLALLALAYFFFKKD